MAQILLQTTEELCMGPSPSHDSAPMKVCVCQAFHGLWGGHSSREQQAFTSPVGTQPYTNSSAGCKEIQSPPWELIIHRSPCTLLFKYLPLKMGSWMRHPDQSNQTQMQGSGAGAAGSGPCVISLWDNEALWRQMGGVWNGENTPNATGLCA